MLLDISKQISVFILILTLIINAGDVREVGSIPRSGRSPGGGMATHSSILAWRIPWTEEPDGLQSTGSQRVGQDSDELACIHTVVAKMVARKLVPT